MRDLTALTQELAKDGLILEFCESVGPDMNDPFVTRRTIAYKIRIPGGKAYGRGVSLDVDVPVTDTVYEILEESIRKTVDMIKRKAAA